MPEMQDNVTDGSHTIPGEESSVGVSTSGPPMPEPPTALAPLRESIPTFFAVRQAMAGEHTGSKWDVVMVESGWSKNDTLFTDEVLADAVSRGLFEGIAAAAYRFGKPLPNDPKQDYFSHLPEGVERGNFAQNVVGFFKNAVFGPFIRPDGTPGKGVLAEFHVSEAHSWLRTLLKEAYDAGRQFLGFSIDAIGKLRKVAVNGRSGNYVERIEEVKTTDLVTEPAAGGVILRVTAAVENAMPTTHQTDGGPGVSQLRRTEGMPDGINDTAPITEAEKRVQEMESRIAEAERRIRQKEVRLTIREALNGSGLPETSKARITRLYDGAETVDTTVLNKDIADEQAHIASLRQSFAAEVKNMGDAHTTPPITPAPTAEEIQITESKRERLGKALEGMFARKNVDGVRRFSNLKEALAAFNPNMPYQSPGQMAKKVWDCIKMAIPQAMREFSLNEDIEAVDKHKVSIRENWRHVAPQSIREAVGATDFTVAFGDTLQKRLEHEYRADNVQEWRLLVSSYENLNDATNTFKISRIGGIGVLPVVNAGNPYQDLVPSQTEQPETMTPYKYGGIYQLDWEAILADDLRKLVALPIQLGKSANRTIARNVIGIFENNSNLSSDTTAFFHSNHSNTISGTPAITYADMVTGAIQMMNQTELDSSLKLGIKPKYVWTGPEYAALALEICNSNFKKTSNEDATVRNVLGADWGITPVMSVELGLASTTKYCWYLTADPADCEIIAVGFLGGQEKPELFVQGVDTPMSGAYFDSDVITLKVRNVHGVAPVDYRGCQASLKAS
jgi:hypothetical protein